MGEIPGSIKGKTLSVISIKQSLKVMTEIQAEVGVLGEEPISIRGYIGRDDELMVKLQFNFLVTK